MDDWWFSMLEAKIIDSEKSQNGKVVMVPYELIEVEHNGKQIYFVTPMKGVLNHFLVAEKKGPSILELNRPTMEEMVALFYFVAKKGNRYHNIEISRILKNGFKGFNGIKYVPREGMYVEDRPKTQNGRVVVNKENARFASFGFEVGYQTPSEFSKNEGVRAIVGEEGARKLAGISNFYRKAPRFFGLYSVRKEFISTPILYGTEGILLNSLGQPRI